MGVALLAPAKTRCEAAIAPRWIAGLFLALGLFFFSLGPATAGLDDGYAAYERGDYATSFREFMPLAIAGDPRAQFLLGGMYLNGLGVSQDGAEAVRWLRLAADQGFAEAQYTLGLMYHSGLGVPQEDTEAVRWYRLAADQGFAEAQYYLGVMYEGGEGVSQNDVEAVRWYRLAADQNLAKAQDKLGWMYAHGRGGTRDDAQAVRWFRLAADQGFALAQTHLGVMYLNGRGVLQDDPEAMSWFRLAAAQGDAEAQFKIGLMYAEGRGVSPDHAEAVRWFRLAADQGHAVAQILLGTAYAEGRGVPPDPAEAVRWFRLAADQGNPSGQAVLGVMYAAGRGVPQDDVLAYMWFILAVSRSPEGGEIQEQAILSRDRVAAQMSRAEIARGQELARNWRPGSAAGSEGGSFAHGDSGRDTSPSSPGRIVERQRVIETQQSLDGLGYDPGPIDGVVGPRTRAAIRAFQADVGLPVDGQISDELHAALTDAASRSVAARSAPTPLHLYATGTGFAVSEAGYLVTNHHVVGGCAEVWVQAPGQDDLPAVVVAADQENDLALLAAPVRLPAAVFRGDPAIRAGDSVVAVGFPLHGLLASEANVTTGTVSALAGIGDDARLLQMTVPVQPGNSGGPLLDLQGRVVGVVVSRLDALWLASVAGYIPQNVNFAIKADVVRNFLRASREGISIDEADAEAPRALSPAEVGARAKEFTVLVECWK